MLGFGTPRAHLWAVRYRETLFHRPVHRTPSGIRRHDFRWRAAPRSRYQIEARLGLLVVAGALSAALAGCARGPSLSSSRGGDRGSLLCPDFEAYTASPIRWGNRVDLLLNGEQIFPAQLEAIRLAQTTFTYAQYFYETGPPARALVKAMSERLSGGHPWSCARG